MFYKNVVPKNFIKSGLNSSCSPLKFQRIFRLFFLSNTYKLFTFGISFIIPPRNIVIVEERGVITTLSSFCNGTFSKIRKQHLAIDHFVWPKKVPFYLFRKVMVLQYVVPFETKITYKKIPRTIRGSACRLYIAETVGLQLFQKEDSINCIFL